MKSKSVEAVMADVTS